VAGIDLQLQVIPTPVSPVNSTTPSSTQSQISSSNSSRPTTSETSTTSDQSTSNNSKRASLGVKIGVPIGLFTFGVLLAWVWYALKRRRQTKASQKLSELEAGEKRQGTNLSPAVFGGELDGRWVSDTQEMEGAVVVEAPDTDVGEKKAEWKRNLDR
jgi:hypothetical protein